MIQQASREDDMLAPRHVVEHYRRAYQVINGREPSIRYAGNYWYFVNNEAVHHGVLVDEIARLREMAQKTSLLKSDKNVIHRLIARLRNM